MIKRLLHIVFNLFIILVISCGFTVFKCVKLVNEHKYHHVNNCMKDNSLLLDCFNNCNGFQPFAEEHQMIAQLKFPKYGIITLKETLDGILKLQFIHHYRL